MDEKKMKQMSLGFWRQVQYNDSNNSTVAIPPSSPKQSIPRHKKNYIFKSFKIECNLFNSRKKRQEKSLYNAMHQENRRGN